MPKSYDNGFTEYGNLFLTFEPIFEEEELIEKLEDIVRQAMIALAHRGMEASSSD